MLDNIRPYKMIFIQKASPNVGDAFDFAYIYKFYSNRKDICQRLKYIVRVEVTNDIFAIKFYAARDKKLDNKYNRILKMHNYTETLRIFMTCASIVPLILQEFPLASFVINGAQSLDLESNKIEGRANNQRFRLYKNMATQLFGKKCFEHYEFIEISSYLMVNKKECSDIERKKDRIKETLLNLYDIDS